MKKTFNLLMVIALLISLLPLLSQEQAHAAVTGTPDSASVTVKKYSKDIIDDGERAIYKPLSGAEFTFTQTHTYNPTTDKWTVVSGTPKTFKVTTDGSGTARQNIAKSDLGRYTVEETKTPSGYIKGSDFSVDIPMTSDNGSDLNYNVQAKPKNEKVRGQVELTKTNDKNEALSGVTFNLYKVGTETPVKTGLVTNDQGIIAVKSLEYGEYFFQETAAPSGYGVDYTKKSFEINENNYKTKQTINMKNSKLPTVDKKIKDPSSGDLVDSLNINRDKVYSYQIDASIPTNIGSYKQFKLTDKIDNRLNYQDGTAKLTIDGQDFNGANITYENGELVANVTDFKALKEFAGKKLVLSFDAKIKPDAVLKTGETGIPNTVKLDFNNGGGSYTDPSVPPGDNVPPGENTPPPTTPPTTPPVVVTPQDGGMKISKVDAQTDEIIKIGSTVNSVTIKSGATFDLKNSDGSNVSLPSGSLVTVNGQKVTSLNGLNTGDSGELVIKGLDTGNYQLIETKAPTYTATEDGKEVTKSYRLLEKPLSVKVVAGDDNITTLKVENSKSGWNLPDTGGMGTILFTIIGLGLMILALLLFRRKKNIKS